MKRKNIYILIIIALTIFIITIIPYFITFNSFRFSLDSSDWNAFGSYVSGILGVINLLIFIYLTFYISRLDERRSENERTLQKAIVITQFRLTEIALLDKKLDIIFDTNGTEEKPIVLQRISNIGLFLTNFINQKAYLFPILSSNPNKQLALNLIEKISQFFDIVDEIYGLKMNASLEKRFETKLQSYIFMKNEFIENLQNFTLRELD